MLAIETYSEIYTGDRKNADTPQWLEKLKLDWLLETDNEHEKFDNRPLLEELDIDPSEIWYKIRCILLPVFISKWGYQKHVLRDNPDFWGPLMSVTIFSAISVWGQSHVVGWIYTFWFSGSALIFGLGRVLGGDITYSQSLSIIGYSLLPLSTVCLTMMITGSCSGGFNFLGYVLWIFGIVWSSYSAASLLVADEFLDKKPLITYPIILLYIYFMHFFTGV
ncbi:unnamed protein product [Oikopleura dioica]|uniref:Protein YIPF n=1 Tax=Oikopleura dioica TaxID=34765 RepID=E4XGD4_OIKDI|nr:unnamed protein product [Oikopleura dioica]